MSRAHLIYLCCLVGCFNPSDETSGDATEPTSTEGGTTSGTGTASAPATATDTATDESGTPTGPTSNVDDSSGDPTSASVDSSSGDTTTAGPACGNGEIEGDEVCDDDDLVDGNGCNNDCQPSGRLLWLATFGDLDEDSGNGITVDDAGNIYAVGTIFRGGIDDDVWLSRHAPDGTEDFANLYDGGNYERAQDIAWHSTNDRLYAVGSSNSSDFPQLFWFDNDGTLVDQGQTDPVNINAAAIAAREDAIYWVGGGSGNGIARLAGNGLDVLDAFTEPFPLPAFSPWLAVVVDDSDAPIIAGSSSTEGYIERRLPAGGALDWRTAGLPPIRGLGISPDGELVVTGSVTVPGEQQNVFVARFSADGSEQLWDYDYNGSADLDDAGMAVAVDAEDRIVVAARSQQADTSYAVTLLKLDADGNELWVNNAEANPGYAYPADLAIASDGAISIVGTFFDADGGGDGDIFVAHFAP